MNNPKNNSIITSKDVLILKQLLEDGRKSSSSISKEIDLGREIVNYRIKRLIKENLILKFVPKINDSAYHYREYNILLKLNLDDEISRKKFIEEKIGNKYLIWIIKSGNGWDLMVRLYAAGIDEFKEKLNEILELFTSVLANYYTIISSEDLKESQKEILCKNLFDENSSKPDYNIIKSEKILIDDKDKEIISLLEEDGRIQYKDIANKLNVSSDTIKYRIEKLKTQGVIENFMPVINFNKIGMLEFAAILKFKFLTENEILQLNKMFLKSENIIKAIKSLNFEEYFLNLVFKNETEILEFQTSIENIFKDKISNFEIFRLD